MIPINLWTLLAAAGIAIALFGAGTGVGATVAVGHATKEALAAQATQFAADLKATQDQASAQHKADLAAMDAGKKAQAALDAIKDASNAIMNEVNRAPLQITCLKSPAISAYINGLRRAAAGNNANSVPGTPGH